MIDALRDLAHATTATLDDLNASDIRAGVEQGPLSLYTNQPVPRDLISSVRRLESQLWVVLTAEAHVRTAEHDYAP
jgi:hypothetical protein